MPANSLKLSDLSVSALVAGLIATLTGYTQLLFDRMALAGGS